MDIHIGTVFTYKDRLSDLKQGGVEPINPFRVDSACATCYNGNGGYWVSSANGLKYMFDPTRIKRGL